jgi:hypothetical protein
VSDDFEQGSIAAANAIFNWMGRIYGPTQQRAAIVAWDAGDMFPPAEVPEHRPAPASPTRELAFAQGYTGDTCDQCGQMTMKRTGTCLTCASCGTTTGCA